MITSNKSILSDRPTRSVFGSKTFWGAVLAGVSALSPIIVKDIKAHTLPIGDLGQSILLLSGVGTAIVGSVTGKAPIRKPEQLPSLNKSALSDRGAFMPPAGVQIAGSFLGKDPRDFQRGATRKNPKN